MTTAPTLRQDSRIDVVDALRGFALLAIVLLHNLEHYNIFSDGLIQPAWLTTLDRWVTDAIYFVFAGKAYATFSLLFGFSFYIQMRNARRRGCDFRLRFAWRMLLLVCFSQFHALFYNGDILLLYAVCGLILIPASSWSDRTVIIVATLLMLQPFCWGKIVYACFNPEYVDTNSLFAKYAASAEEVGRTGGLLATLANNIWNGQLYSNFWQVEAGRLFQT
ncbi:MAG: heparan-alpha-glucosaminide N-acetyltransferase domain-containing protein, partial [Muribaculaceae bacterium]|nr:heparan-alpha-glucosaminide N-acetyltransferase domain-containing protein [Muribaculaceae bacterium]